MTKQKALLALLISAALTASCGGGGGGDDGGDPVDGLQMPTKLSVVTAIDDSSTAKVSGIDLNYRAIAGVIATDAVSSFPDTADYNTDEANSWVYDESIQSLGLVNEILCLMEQTRSTAMVNQGAYVALINEDKCSQERDDAASSGTAQSGVSTTEAVTYQRWVVRSTRTDNSSPQYVSIWVPGGTPESPDDVMEAQNILVEVTINEGVSAAKPFGDFVLNFKGVLDGAHVGLVAGQMYPVMTGTLKTMDNASGKPQFELINLTGQAIGDEYTVEIPFSREETAAVLMDDAEGTSGVARTGMSEIYPCWDETTNELTTCTRANRFSVAFEPLYFLRGKDTTGDGAVTSADDQICTDRNHFDTQVWRYNLYHSAAGTFNGRSVAAGQRVALNSGFPFTYTDSNSNDHFGHVGYWGIWTEEELNIGELDGQPIQKQTFDGAAGESYTVQVSEGKARMRVRVQGTLADVADIKFHWYNGWEVSALAYGQEYIVRVNAARDGFEATASVAWGENGPVETALSAPVNVTPDGTTFHSLWMWSEQLGGGAHYDIATPTQITYFQETQLAATDVSAPVTLYCYERCPIGSDTPIAATQESDLFYAASLEPWNAPAPTAYQYQVAAANGVVTLTDLNNNKEVRAPASITVCTESVTTGCLPEWYQWGIGTGVMSPTNPANWWEMWGQDTTYLWETGPQSWNRLVTVLDSAGNAIGFDKPLRMEYKYALGDDPNGDNFTVGTPFMLEYGGPGQLWGFPWQPEPGCDPATNHCRWISALTLKDGVELSDGMNRFVVRGLEKEQRMAETLLSSCADAGLNVENINLALPTTVDGQVTITWSDRPVVTDAPAVIEGELQ